ncbi:DUF262 domain-containing protein [Kocuria palustris]|uniref:DUF262 domain-containing protein n=1 Tax=Kocuria palustris TaxID=71999 RepID=UPI0020430DDA|nr:DUF262 domain-containing protein [Kocuria palustris]MCM3332791.1 DUF262 domain-containing protein [Kocuria palustris]
MMQEGATSAELTDEEVEDIRDTEKYPEPVNYTSQDFDVEGLVRRINKNDILIPRFGTAHDPGIESANFQRGFVWNRPQMDRFIESLLLGYPIPGIFLIKQQDKKYLVLDGQQRLTTLQRFYNGVHDRSQFTLRHVADRFKGFSYEDLPEDLRRQIDNSFVQATIVNLDGTDESLEAVYQIFERLNSGGTQLTPHEIRIALYAGKFVDVLEEINSYDSWRSLYGHRPPHIRDQELVLRILAFFMREESYSRPLKSFLNNFMKDFRNANSQELDSAIELFKKSADLLDESAGRDAFRRSSNQVNAAQSEAIMVGLMRALSTEDFESSQVAEVVDGLKRSETFGLASETSTAGEESVATRFNEATEAFKVNSDER